MTLRAAGGEGIACRTCVHARWQRTEKGNIRPTLAGDCSKARELLDEMKLRAPPCLDVSGFIRHVWVDTSASECDHYQVNQS